MQTEDSSSAPPVDLIVVRHDCLRSRQLMRNCPFCGESGAMEYEEHDGRKFFQLGCRTEACFEFVGGKTTAMPVEKFLRVLTAWNIRTPDLPELTEAEKAALDALPEDIVEKLWREADIAY